jgi:hypothetical protein
MRRFVASEGFISRANSFDYQQNASELFEGDVFVSAPDGVMNG